MYNLKKYCVIQKCVNLKKFLISDAEDDDNDEDANEDDDDYDENYDEEGFEPATVMRFRNTSSLSTSSTGPSCFDLLFAELTIFFYDESFE